MTTKRAMCACRFCRRQTRNVGGVCDYCREKLVLVRKIIQIGERIKHDAQIGALLRDAIWKRDGD